MAKVLVVDDHPVNRNLIATLLGYRDHTVLEACDGAEALTVAEAELPDLVITDLLMPVMDGYELVRELRAVPALAATRVIFYTANYLQDEARPLALAAGVRHILAKPADPATVLAMVDEALSLQADAAPLPAGEYQREHLRALSAKLVEKVRELEAAEGALRESEGRFRSLAEFCPLGIVSLDSAAQVTYTNPRLRQITGMPDPELPRPIWSELLHPDDRERITDGLAQAFGAGVPFADRARLVRRDGETRWVDMHAAPVAGDGAHPSYVGTVEDVTEAIAAQQKREELEARLRTADRLESLGQLAAGVAHDFNNLLGAILNYAHFVSAGVEALTAPGDDNPRLAQMGEDVAAIRKGAERAAELTHQLLTFGRREILRPEVLDLNSVVREAEQFLGRTIGEHVRLHTRLEPELWAVAADRGRLEQVVVNLVVNARDAIAETGSVTLATDNVELDAEAAQLRPGVDSGRYSRLSVTDDGAGMAPEVAARAFEPFFTTKPKGKGTGLGLATVYGVVKQLGGHVDIYSEPGTGTTVRVYLPAVDAAPSRPVIATDAFAAGTGQAVLVVDDDEDIRAVTTRILRENGYHVTPADSAASAARLLEDRSVTIDLLLTDVIMPDMSGRALAARAAELRPSIAVLFMSGYAEDLFAPRATIAPDVEVLEKPFTSASLLKGVSRRLGPRSKER